MKAYNIEIIFSGNEWIEAENIEDAKELGEEMVDNYGEIEGLFGYCKVSKIKKKKIKVSGSFKKKKVIK